MREKRKYIAIDCAKLFFCLCIIALHCKMHTIFGGIISYGIEKVVIRIAVPFFFVVSGFFWGGEWLESTSDIKARVKKYVLRLLPPLIVFGGINNVLEIIKMIQGHKSARYILKDIIQHVLFYQYGALWYVGASIVGMILLYPFLKKGRLNLALGVGFLLYVFALLSNNYYFLSQQILGLQGLIDSYLKNFISGRNGLFVGFFLLALGIKTEEIARIKIGNWDIKKRGLLLLACGTIYLIEIVLVMKKTAVDDGALYVSHIIFIPALIFFLLEIKCEMFKKQAPVFRRLSVGMYFLHRIVISSIDIIEYWLDISLGNVIVKTCIVLVVSMTICLFAQRKKDTLLYKLFS